MVNTYNDLIRPELTCEEAKDLILNNYYINVSSISTLKAYDDQNFLVIDDNDNLSKKYVFKISNSIDSSIPGLIDAINDITLLIHESTLVQVPYPLATKDGKLLKKIKLSNGDFVIRLLNYISGDVLVDTPFHSSIIYESGLLLGKITKLLGQYSNNVLKKRKTLWSLTSVPELTNYLSVIKDDIDRKICEHAIKKYQKEVNLARLKQQIIHGDFNEHNIIVNNKKIVGLIDFTDTNLAPRIFDLAILCCYLAVYSADFDVIDPLKVPGIAINGYCKTIKLTDYEWSILPVLISSRLTQSLILGRYAYEKNPSSEYVLSSAKHGWPLLRRLYYFNDQELEKSWRNTNYS